MNPRVFYFVRAMLMTLLAAVFLCQLIQSRYEQKRTRIILAVGILSAITANILLYLLIDPLAYIRFIPLFLNLPVCLLFVFLSRHRGLRICFTLMTHFAAIYTVTLAGIVCALPFSGNPAADMAGRLLAACLILLAFRCLRPLYLFMQDTLKRGWALFCLIPLAYYLSCYYYIMRIPPADRSKNLPFQCFLAVITIISYVVILFFFDQTRQHAQKENELQLLKVTAAALQKQSETMIEGERRLSTLRHDIRHYVHSVASMIREGNIEQALEITGRFDKSLLQAQNRQWCENKAVNAVLSYYLALAEKEHIQVEARLDMPDALPVDGIELSIAFANMVENAIHACCRQPEGEKRRLVLHAVSTPQLVIEVANTYGSEVSFGKDGLPLPSEAGHGMGARSIRSFAESCGAVCLFSAEDGIFRVRLMMDQTT